MNAPQEQSKLAYLGYAKHPESKPEELFIQIAFEGPDAQIVIQCNSLEVDRLEEREFWGRLEYRLGAALSGGLWCDGVLPTNYLLDGPSPEIQGRAWLLNNDTSLGEWKFTLLLPKHVRAIEEIDWGSVMPPTNATKWLSFDERKRCIEIDANSWVRD